jgi:hypothetical protein
VHAVSESEFLSWLARTRGEATALDADGCTEAELDPSTLGGLYDLARHARPSHATAAHGLRWRNLDDRVGRLGGRAMMEWARLVAIGVRFSVESRA